MGDSDASLGKPPALVTGRPYPLPSPLCVHGWPKAHGAPGHLKGTVGDCRVGSSVQWLSEVCRGVHSTAHMAWSGRCSKVCF